MRQQIQIWWPATVGPKTVGPRAGLFVYKSKTGGLKLLSGGLESRVTRFASVDALTRPGALAYSLGAYSVGPPDLDLYPPWGLQFGGLQSRATRFGCVDALTRPGPTVCGTAGPRTSECVNKSKSGGPRLYTLLFKVLCRQGIILYAASCHAGKRSRTNFLLPVARQQNAKPQSRRHYPLNSIHVPGEAEQDAQ
jgi:hypothetical protein